MKPYIATETRDFDYGYELDDLLEGTDIIITGNRWFVSYNKELLDKAHDEDLDIEDPIQLLSKYTGKQYYCYQMCGYSKGDWQGLYYPKGTEQSLIDEIEAIYFGKYTAFNIEELDDNTKEYEYSYTTKVFDFEDQLEKLCQQLECTQDELEIRIISGYVMTPTYETL